MSVRPSDRFAPDEPIPDGSWWRDLARQARALAIEAVPPLYRTVKRGVSDLWYGPPARFDGVVTGASGSGYTVKEARFTPGVGWAERPGGRVVTNAFEYNLSATVPVGSAVECRLSIAGDWRFWRGMEGVGSGSGCQTLPTISFAVAGTCCRPFHTDFVLTHGGDVIGSCSTPVAGVADHVGGGCDIEVDLPPGTVLDYSITPSGYEPFTGSVTVPDCGSGVIADDIFLLDRRLPDTITLTDSLGNAIPLTRLGPAGTIEGRRWQGSRAYMHLHPSGAMVTTTLGYTWSCSLTISDISPFGNESRVLYLNAAQDPTDLRGSGNYGAYEAGTTPPPGAVDWPTPPAESCASEPLLMEYVPWHDVAVYRSGGFAPPVFKKGNFCLNRSSWFPAIFTCGSAFTVSL